jgi:hypothetical protein
MASAKLQGLLGIAVALVWGGCGQTTGSQKQDEPRDGVAPESGDATEPVTCDELGDDAAVDVPVHIVNRTSRTIHLGQATASCTTAPLFLVHDANDKVLGEPGRETCTDVLAGATGGIPLICHPPRVLTLIAGESAQVSWSGLFSQFVELPAGCAEHAAKINGAPACWRSRRPMLGSYRFSAMAGLDWSCASTSGGCTACEPHSGGGCEMAEAIVPQLVLEASADVTLPMGPSPTGSVPIELAFND